MRRGPKTEWRYLLNTSSDHLEVHDLDNEQAGEFECQIDEIIRANNAKYLIKASNPTELVNWLRSNSKYDGCKYCLEALHTK